MRRAALLTLVLSLVLVAPASAAQDNFGRLFPNLPGFTAPTNQQIADLAQSMLDPNLDSENNCLVTTPPPSGCVFSGFTYGDQFIDHDITLDTAPSPLAPVDPTTLPNGRTFALDLDSVYAGGPSVSPQLYVGNRFKVQEPNPNGVRDLPRNGDGSAVLVEKRNDENQIISQIHVAFLKAHNRLIDEGLSFATAQRTLQLHYQMLVAQDYLPHVLNAADAAGVVDKNQPLKVKAKKMTPVEFSVGAFRNAHSNVRRAYRLNGTNNCQNLQVFAFANPAASLMGGRQIQAGRQIDWGMFFDDFAEPTGCVGLRNIQRKTDTLLSSSLFQLPIPGAEAAGDNVLAFRNMIRGKFYGMPSGQAVAQALGIPVITPAELDLGPGFETGTPLWFYILAESSRVEGGQRLGPVGSAITAATFAGILQDDKSSYLNTNGFVARADITGPDGKMSFADLLRFARVAG